MNNESKIQKQIADRLSKCGWLVIKLERTNWNGIPDLMALKDGRVIFLEVKTPEGKVAELQEHRIKVLRQNGFFANVVRDVKDVDVFCYKH